MRDREVYKPSHTDNRDYSQGVKNDLVSNVIVTNKYDQHFKKANLSYVMRRTTNKAQKNKGQYDNYRTSTTQVYQFG